MKRILIAYDGSETSKIAIKELEQLIIKNEGTELCLLSVCNISNPHTNAMMQRNIKDKAVEKIQRKHDEKEKKEHVQRIKEQLTEIKDDLDNKGIIAEVKVLTTEGNANPGEVICEYTEENDFNLIVVGSRGLGNVKKVVLGSVSNYIVNNSKLPVLVIK